MNRWFKLLAFAVIPGAIIVFIIAPGYIGAWLGRTEADRDIHSGILMLKSGGLRRPWNDRYESILWERYSVKAEHLGRVTSSFMVSYINAYNKRVMIEIKSKIGDIPFDDISREARAGILVQ